MPSSKDFLSLTKLLYGSCQDLPQSPDKPCKDEVSRLTRSHLALNPKLNSYVTPVQSTYVNDEGSSGQSDGGAKYEGQPSPPYSGGRRTDVTSRITLKGLIPRNVWNSQRSVLNQF